MAAFGFSMFEITGTTNTSDILFNNASGTAGFAPTYYPPKRHYPENVSYWSYNKGFETLQEARDYESSIDSKGATLFLSEKFKNLYVEKKLKKKIIQLKTSLSRKQIEYHKRKRKIERMYSQPL